MDEALNSEGKEVTPQLAEATIAEQGTPEEDLQTHPAQEETDQDRNWKELRRKEQESQRREQQASEKVKIQDEVIKNLLMAQQNVAQQQPNSRVE